MYPCTIYMLVCVFLSFIVDWRTFTQINYNYINRRLAIASAALDLTIFVGAMWETVIMIQEAGEQYGVAIYVIWVLLTIVSYFRIPNILYFVFFALCCSWIYCLPDWCCCVGWLVDESIDQKVIDMLTLNQWTYSSEAMLHTE